MLSSDTGTTDANGDETPRKSPQQSPRPQPQPDKQVNPLEKIEQLLICSICLDRYKNPKLLPCQHTYCLPCLDNYVDTIHHNLKCPECRSEHSIPYEGAKGFPSNLTLTGFLDIHLEATDDSSEQIEAYISRYNMERCKICDEKSELEICFHCDRKTCKECRNSHMEMLKRDLGRLLNQIRRLSNRVKEASDGVSKNIQQLDSNVQSTQAEVHDYFLRYQSELKRREEHFIGEVELFAQNEKRLMKSVRDVLEAEHNNLSDSCSWVESALSGSVEVTEKELCRYKTILVDGVENLRSFNPDSEEMFSKKIRFSPGDDASKLPTAICNFGELTVSLPQFGGRYLPLEQQYLPKTLRLGLESDSYKTSYRTALEDKASQMSKYKRSDDYSQRRRPLQLDDDSSTTYTRSISNRSPLTINSNGTTNSSNNASSSLYTRSSLLNPTSTNTSSPNSSTITTEIEEPASSVVKNNASSSDLLSRRQQNRAPLVLPSSTPSSSSTSSTPNSELAKKSQSNNVNASGKEKQTSDSVLIQMRQKPPLPRQQSSNDSNNGSRLSTPILVLEATTPRRRSLIIETTNSNAQKSGDKDSSLTPTRRQKFKIICQSTNPIKRSDSLEFETGALTTTAVSSASARQSNGEHKQDTSVKSGGAFAVNSSSFSNYPSSTISEAAATVSQTVARLRSQDHLAMLNSSRDELVNASPPPSTPRSRAAWMERRRQRFLRSRTNPDIFGSMDESDRARLKASTNTQTTPTTALSARVQQLLSELEFKSALADNSTTTPSPRSVVNGSTIQSNGLSNEPESSDSRSRFARRSSIVPDREISTERALSRPRPNRTSTLLSLPLINYGSKSKPRLVFGRRGDGPVEFNMPRGVVSLPGSEFAVCDSCNNQVKVFNKNAKLLRTFGIYGSENGQLDNCTGIAYSRNKQQLIVSDRFNNRVQMFDLEGKLVKTFGVSGNGNGQFKEPWGIALDEFGLIYVVDKDNHRIQVFDSNGNYMRKFGSKGGSIGQFNHPLYIAIHRRTQNIFISDSANHRICVHDHDGVPILNFGIEGFHTGQLKLPRGLALDDQGFVVVADSGNNRIQIFTPEGKFVHGFGTWGVSPGQLKGVEGVALMDDQIVVTDRENHRLQIF